MAALAVEVAQKVGVVVRPERPGRLDRSGAGLWGESAALLEQAHHDVGRDGEQHHDQQEPQHASRVGPAW